jgi:hypothetical protein
MLRRVKVPAETGDAPTGTRQGDRHGKLHSRETDMPGGRAAGRTAPALALAVAMAAGAGPAAAADMVILESDAPALHPGTILPEETPVQIERGRRALVIDALGRTRIVRGPCSGTLVDCARRPTAGGKGDDAPPIRLDPMPRLGAIRRAEGD